MNGCLIISLCMIANTTLPAWKLVWFEICVAGFYLNVHLSSLCSLFFLGFDMFWQIIFEFLCLFQVWFVLVSGLSFGLFSGQTNGFRFDLWLNQEFRVIYIALRIIKHEFKIIKKDVNNLDKTCHKISHQYMLLLGIQFHKHDLNLSSNCTTTLYSWLGH
jgi:hypothetical protein